MHILLLFYSHGHMDHISAVPQHVSKRSLFGMKMAKYYTPHHLKDNLLAVCEIYHQMNETSDALNKVDVIAVKPGENVEVSQGCGNTMPDLSDLVPFHSGQV